MKVLILCTYQSTYVVQLYSYVKKYYQDVHYSLFTQDKVKDYYIGKICKDVDEAIYSFGNHEYLCGVVASKLPYFDIIHSLWIERFWGEHATIFRRKCKYWLCSVGGSDVYRDSKKMIYRMLQKRVIHRADWISSEGTQTQDYFNELYGNLGETKNHSIIRFGVDILDAIDKMENISKEELRKKYKIPSDKVVLMCGTNARKEHQHVEMLHAIAQMPQEIKNRIFLLLPMTYGGDKDYIDEISKLAQKIGKTRVLTDFLNTKEMAEVAKLTDILIHVQTTDQLSSAMLSHMYVGNVVIAGAWLPYDDLKNRGIEFFEVAKISELSNTIPKIIESFDDIIIKCKDNKNKVHDISSWEKSAKEWYNLYSRLIENKETSYDNSI